MLGFVQNFIAPQTNPIGIDFGTDCLRAAQVREIEGDHTLLAAASMDVPIDLDAQSRLQFFAQNIRDLLTAAPFSGRHVVLSLPAGVTHLLNLSIARVGEKSLKKAVADAVKSQLPFEESDCLIRHVVAGEIERGTETKLRIVAMAAQRAWVNQYLEAAGEARLDVVGMSVEPLALLNCFGQVYRRESDFQTTQMFLDMGGSGTRAIIARRGKILFARAIPIGGIHFAQAVAETMKISLADAHMLRTKVAALRAEKESESDSFDGESRDFGRPQKTTADLAMQMRRVDEASRPIIEKLIGRIEQCRMDHEAAFPADPVERLIFIGGEARQRLVCKYIAGELDLPARIGDPFCRMARTTRVGPECGIDRRQPQPGWAVAAGLSMGPRALQADGHTTIESRGFPLQLQGAAR